MCYRKMELRSHMVCVKVEQESCGFLSGEIKCVDVGAD